MCALLLNPTLPVLVKRFFCLKYYSFLIWVPDSTPVSLSLSKILIHILFPFQSFSGLLFGWKIQPKPLSIPRMLTVANTSSLLFLFSLPLLHSFVPDTVMLFLWSSNVARLAYANVFLFMLFILPGMTLHTPQMFPYPSSSAASHHLLLLGSLSCPPP